VDLIKVTCCSSNDGWKKLMVLRLWIISYAILLGSSGEKYYSPTYKLKRSVITFLFSSALFHFSLMKASRSFSALSFSETINYFSFSTSAILTYPSNNSWRAVSCFIKDSLVLCSAAFTSFSNSSLSFLK